jgi:tRNA(fMet)-specific endonuclease VapC
LDFTPEIGTIFKNSFRKYSLSHRPQIADMLIASFALHYEMPLFTLNTKDFSFVENIKLV